MTLRDATVSRVIDILPAASPCKLPRFGIFCILRMEAYVPAATMAYAAYVAAVGAHTGIDITSAPQISSIATVTSCGINQFSL
jgi:hypothetical protein